MTVHTIDNKEFHLHHLLRKVSRGKVVLFLGAGVNIGCTNSKGQDAPLGKDLARAIKDEFFPDEDVPLDLRTICAYVETMDSRRSLERLIYDIFIDYHPSEEVLKQIPRFKWRSIYTTNFDRLVEKAYEEVANPVQQLYPIYSDRDPQDFYLGPEVPYYKLHGCITKISSNELPLILTLEDYATFRENRGRLFARLQDDLYDYTILFVGYSLSDPNFHSLFFEVQNDMHRRDFPRCYAISPHTPPPIVHNWDAKKVTILDLTAAEFFERAAEEASVEPYAASQEKQEEATAFTEEAAPRLDLGVAQELLKAFEFVDDSLGYDTAPDPENFYRGDQPSWATIRERCDADRSIYDQIMDDILYVEEEDKPGPVEVAIVTAEAGSGKSTLLKRLAYDHALLFDGFCLFHRTFREIPVPSLEELHRIIQRRIFVYVDDAADNIGTVSYLTRRAESLQLPITVVCAERKNEWNAVKERLYPIIPAEYELPYLDDEEIDNILQVLEQNNYLCELAYKSVSERRAIFREKAEKQLLVAMREATEGKAFDEIIQDEYDSIPNDLGRRTYLHISALHRLGVSVRAGLLRRLSGVSYEDFEDKLLAPCERVIVVERNEALDEFLYRTRHPHIAEIVCRYAMDKAEKIASTYLGMLDKMDLGYSSDLYSFRQLIRADNIIDAMPTIAHRRRFYDRALKLSNEDPYVFQQYGLMERRNGDIDEAYSRLAKAHRLQPDNQAYKHSYARVLYERSLRSQNPAQADKLFKEAQELLGEIMRDSPRNPYAYDSYSQNLIGKADRSDDSLKQEYLEEAHEVLLRGISRCPDKSHLRATDAKIFDRLGEYEKAKTSLLMSHRGDPTSVRTALLLGRLLIREEEYQEAFNVITETLKYNELNEALNLLAAKVALTVSPEEHDRTIRFLKRAFDPEYIDSEANFLLAVEYFRADQYSEAAGIFGEFRRRKSYTREHNSYKVREFVLDEQGKQQKFEGEIVTLFHNYGFITPDLLPTDIYFRPEHLYGAEAKHRMRVEFTVGFNLFGSIAQDLQPV